MKSHFALGRIGMEKAVYEQIYDLNKQGIKIFYDTKRGEYNPPHKHDALELHYNLNGTGNIIFNGKTHSLVSGEFILIDSDIIHHTQCSQVVMDIRIYISRGMVRYYVPDIDRYVLECSRDSVTSKNLAVYLKICDLMKTIPETFVKHQKGYEMNCLAVVLQVLFLLVNNFAKPKTEVEAIDGFGTDERITKIMDYMNEHYMETASVEEIADYVGLNKEYFCRYFKQRMGITYTRNINLIRLVHIYEELINSDAQITEIIDKHGFTNHRLFREMFREIYGCTPKEVRKK